MQFNYISSSETSSCTWEQSYIGMENVGQSETEVIVEGKAASTTLIKVHGLS